MCWRHKWYIINKYTDDVIRSMAKDPKFDPDLNDYIGSVSTYKEKVCLKCEKYVDEITPRYLLHLERQRKARARQARADAIVKKVKKKGKRMWER